MGLKVTLLGTGTSGGVPSLGCDCAVCRSTDPRDARLRCAALVETDATRLLIDCGPDIRQQLMPFEFRPLDGLLLTHGHYDHLGGIDDLRPFCVFGEIDIYADACTQDAVRRMMPYCFEKDLYPGVPLLKLHDVVPNRAFRIGDIEIVPIRVMHGNIPILGYRFGDFAYITDMKSIGKSEMSCLSGVRKLVVNALRFEKEHHSHQLVRDAVAFSQKVGANETYLIHVNHGIGLYSDASRRLPDGVVLAYDGMVINASC